MKSIPEIFQDRTIYNYSKRAVPTTLLKEIYDLMKLGPTSGNSCPLRIVFVTSSTEKAKLCQVVMEGNIDKVKSAPVTAIFAYDLEFFKLMAKTNPVSPAMQEMFANSKEMAISTAERNSTLQAAILW